MSIRDFFEHQKKGFSARPVYLLYSDDPYLLKEAFLSVKNGIPEPERDFGFYAFDLDVSDESAPVSRIIDILLTIPFMGGRQVVAVENAQKLSEADIGALEAYIGNPSPGSVLFLFNEGSLKKAHKEGLKGAMHIHLDIKERDLPLWISQKASQKGIRLTGAAVERLIGTIGPEAGLLSSEVEKLSLLGKETIEAEDVAEVVRGPGDYDVFDLIDALRAKDAPRVFKVYEAVSRTQEPYSMLGALNWHYGRLGDSLKDKGEVFALLNEADLMVKSSGGLFPLEYLLLKLLRL